MTPFLHIVSFNVPWPADYGGVIDVYYRIKALSELGVRVKLHCYAYGRPSAKELEVLCEEVYYYRRQTWPHKLLTQEPYIVSSRQSRLLLDTLLKDDAPVLLEGLHCCWLLPMLRAAALNRTLLVRAHNVEHHYYQHLAKSERCVAKRLYLRSDAHKLEQYESVLKNASGILSVTEADAAYFREKGYAPVYLMPPYHGQGSVCAPNGKGNYALFQGDLSVADNQRAVEELLNEVFSDGRFPFVVAGRYPSRKLRQLVMKCHNATLVANPSDKEMFDLLRQSHVCVLCTNQATGLKLKLLHALYSGRFCLVNSKMVAGTSLGALCSIADTSQAMRDALVSLFQREFTEKERQEREKVLMETYSDRVGARRLVDLLEKIGKRNQTKLKLS